MKSRINRQFLLCILLAFSLCLFACGNNNEDEKLFPGLGDDSDVEQVNNNGEGTGAGEGNADGSRSDATASKANSGDAGKEISGNNAVGADTSATDGTVTANPENLVNLGGIQVEVPASFKKKAVYVGAGLTYESTADSSMLRCFYYDNAENIGYLENPEAFADGEKDSLFEERFVGEYLKNYELTADETVTVAGFAGRKISYKGIANGDCYREGPVRNLVEASLETVCIYDDIDNTVVVIVGLCKTGKYDSVDKQLSSMLTTASAVGAPAEKNPALYGNYYIENGGFGFSIPEIWGDLLECSYDNYEESYTYCYGASEGLCRSLGSGMVLLMNLASRMESLGIPMGLPMGGFGGIPEGMDFSAGGATDAQAGFAGENGNDTAGAEFGDAAGIPGDFGGAGMIPGGFGGIMGGMGGFDINRYLANEKNNWLNVFAVRSVFTQEEFASIVDTLDGNVGDLLGMFMSGCTVSDIEKIRVDDMDGIRFTCNAVVNEVPTECKMLVVNNIKDRFLVVLTSFYDEGSEYSAAFDEVADSMTLNNYR